ncbi:MAG: UDP-N-acetylmuramate--L-alanine ligase [Candidatus Bipolaricaulota bacterium]|nr:UDP-N-acetylmuramate--L-alanine ligase [Candidatus Bipolaricaulota bacterium]
MTALGQRYHLVGIGGSGMSGLASILVAHGAKVSGSDLRPSSQMQLLRSAGVDVHVGHAAEWISSDLDGVIVSSAIPMDNVEVVAARERKVPIVRRLHAMASVMQQYSSVGVVGTHGKTTTTAMTATLLRAVGMDPSYLIGAHCPGLEGSAHLGRGRWFVAEVDESDGLFTDIRPLVAVLTNIGRDHLPTYRHEEAIRAAFLRYVQQAERVVLSIDDPQVRKFAALVDGAITVGLDVGASVRASNVAPDRFETVFDLSYKGKTLGRYRLHAPGLHNVRNALCAVGAAIAAGADPRAAAEAIPSLALPHRRFEILEENGVTVVDDFAHTPEEVKATLDAIRAGWPNRRIVAIFQPHRYSRTQILGHDFGRALAQADVAIVTSIYAACETPVAGVSSQEIVDVASTEARADVYSIPDKPAVIAFLKETIRPGDFIISFGAGDIWTVTDELAHFLKEGSFCVA